MSYYMLDARLIEIPQSKADDFFLLISKQYDLYNSSCSSTVISAKEFSNWDTEEITRYAGFDIANTVDIPHADDNPGRVPFVDMRRFVAKARGRCTATIVTQTSFSPPSSIKRSVILLRVRGLLSLSSVSLGTTKSRRKMPSMSRSESSVELVPISPP